MIRRYQDGDATVTIDGALEAFVLRAVRAASGGTLEIMEEAADALAAISRGQWYDHVTRRTGLSGDIQAITTISEKQIKVSIGSTDARRVKFKNVRRTIDAARERGEEAPTTFTSREVMLAAFVHEAGPLSMTWQPVSHDEYWRAKPDARGPYPQLRKLNPEAAGGRKLLQLLVRVPTKKLALKLGPEIAAEIARRTHV